MTTRVYSSPPHTSLVQRIVTLEQQIAASHALGTESHRQLLAERDRSQALALDLEAARDNLRDANSMLASALSDCLRLQAISAEMSKQVAVRDLADIERRAELEQQSIARNHLHATLTQRQRAQTVQVTRASAVARAYHSQSMIFDISDTDVVDPPEPGRERTVRIPEPLSDFGGAM